VHVGLNLVFLVPGEVGGMETYARELIAALARERRDVRLTAFLGRDAAGLPLPAGVERVEVPVSARSRPQWVWGEQRHLPPLAARAGVDLLHSLATTAPGWGRFRRITTVHDLHYRVVPDAHFGVRGLAMRMLVPLAAWRSHRVIAISRATARDVERHLHVPRERIDVVHEGFGVSPAGAATPPDALRARLGLGERRVVLSVSAKRPHKNLARLLEALAAIDATRRPALVLPGYRTPYEDELRALAARLGVDGDVRFEGWVGAADLEGLYALADAFVFPSLHEGFGLPVLEAMARGVPVACADRASLPEVAGDAALLFDPEDVGAITRAMEALLGDGDLAARLRRAGPERAARFTWAAAARGTLEAYERALA
jgi:glycosyltransferase involved in cell wall biosynthesis